MREVRMLNRADSAIMLIDNASTEGKQLYFKGNYFDR